MVSATYSLSPIGQFWKKNFAGCQTHADPTDTKIIFHPPVLWGCNAEWQSAQDYPIKLQNAKLTVQIGGAYTLFGNTSGGIEFDVYGLNQNGAWVEIYSLAVGQMSRVPSDVYIGDVSEYTTLRFYVKAHGLTCSGCTPYVQPVSFTLSGDPPSASTKVNMTVLVKDAKTNLPIANATVNLTDAFYNVNTSAITDNSGQAVFSDVPFNSADSYTFVATANGYTSATVSFDGSNLSENQFSETITLSESTNTLTNLLTNKYFLALIILVIIVSFVVIIVKKPSAIKSLGTKTLNLTKKAYGKIRKHK